MAVADKRVTGAALTGSGALGHEDAWSDIDLAFGVADEVDLAEMIADWSDRIYQEHAVVHHTDVTAGATIDSGAAVKAARSAAAAVSMAAPSSAGIPSRALATSSSNCSTDMATMPKIMPTHRPSTGADDDLGIDSWCGTQLDWIGPDVLSSPLALEVDESPLS